MSLLLDALNKTSGQSKPAEQQTPDPDNNQPAEIADDSPSPSATSSLELTLEEQEQPLACETSVDAIEDDAEIEVDVDFDEAEFSALLDDDDLSRDIQHAAQEATFDADTTSAMDRIEQLGEEIASLPSMPPLAGADHQNQDYSTDHASSHDQRNATETQTQASAETEITEPASETASPPLDDDPAPIEQAPELQVQDSDGHLIIDAQAEPATLAEEVLQDAPLVQAYSQAQKKRGQILLLIAISILLVATGIIYKLVFSDTVVQADANSFDPVTQQLEGLVQSSVVLEEVDPDSIPARLSMPEFSSATNTTENIILIEPARAASDDLRRAYTALSQGRLEQAERLYAKLSATEVNKVAALSGLASASIAKNDTDNARAHLQHILSVDRHNAWAVATLAALPAKESAVSESNSNSMSQLKSLRTTDPDNHQIAYLLGNKFAAAGIWTEAQAAYFDAFSLDSQNGNYAFNLAVALDHLGKSKQATDFYLQALQIAKTRGADFDIASVRKRLQQGDR